jgi:enterochelin esterase-like enzyme
MVNSFTEFLSHLRSLTAGEAAAYVNAYITSHEGGFPIVEGNTAHFIYRAKPDDEVIVGGEWNGFDHNKAPMKPVGGGLLHYQHDFEPDARLDYLFFQGGEGFRDPLNPPTGEGGSGARSELAMPEYRRPIITIEQLGTPSGSLHPGQLESSALGETRTYTVYLPNTYDGGGEPFPSVYFHDGGDYLTMGKATIILDNLIHGGSIPPLVAVFVPPVRREQDYTCKPEYACFFTDELVPETQRLYNLDSNRAQRAIAGPSLGGLISLYIASLRPDLFGLVCAQSSVARSWNPQTPFDAPREYEQTKLPLRLHMVIGTYEDCFALDEQGRCRDLLTPARELRSVLKQAGYEHGYTEQHQGHSWGLWRDSLGDTLQYLFMP